MGKIMLLHTFLMTTVYGLENSAASDKADPGYWYSGEGSDAYFKARSACKWSAPISAPNFWGDSFLYTNIDTYNQFWHDAGRNKLLVRECHTPALDREGNIWVIRRVGPFNTTGGAKENDVWQTTKFHEQIS